jgi:hypothetical protein
MKTVKLLIILPNREQMTLTFDAQSYFNSYNWFNFKIGDPVYDDNGETIGYFYSQDDENVFLTLNFLI